MTSQSGNRAHAIIAHVGGKHANARTQVRPEIQGLRALAVALVVVYHLFPNHLPGGYVGVDVFFVISGYLITSHLLKEVRATGKVRIARFWARRARRLLPASMLVLALTAIATMLVAPRHLWEQFLGEVAAAAVYVQNWLLASNSVDYLAAANTPSPVQHFWSLSVEEQFYIGLPLAIAVVLLVARRQRERALLWVFAVAGALSLIYSIVLTTNTPSVAYFATPTRVWEFAAGGLLAFAAGALPRFAKTATIAGLGAIAVSAFLYTSATPFPGYTAALPVLGTVAVIAAGNTYRSFGFSPVQWLGDVSYSVYLWHWPLIVLLPYVIPGAGGIAAALVILPVTLVLAALTKRYVEDPFRTPKKWTRRSWPSFALAGISSLLVVSVAGCGMQVEQQRAVDSAAHVEQVRQSAPDCWGAAGSVNDCEPAGAIIDPTFAKTDQHGIDTKQCVGGTLTNTVGDDVQCLYGNPDADTTVVLFGDSHARQWMGALDELAAARDWRVVTLVRSSCPVGEFWVGVRSEGCAQWREEAISRIIELQPDLVLSSSLTGWGYEVVTRIAPAEEQVAGYAKSLTRLTDAGLNVVVIKDTPYLPVAAPDCAATGGDCAFPRAEVLDQATDYFVQAAEMLRVPHVAFDEVLCPDGACRAILGGVVVYYDAYHFSDTFARSMAPVLGQALDQLD